MLPLAYRHSCGWDQNPQLHSYRSRVILHAVQITMWDPSLTTQGQLADSIKPQTLGLKSTTLTTGPHRQTNVLKHNSNLIYIFGSRFFYILQKQNQSSIPSPLRKRLDDLYKNAVSSIIINMRYFKRTISVSFSIYDCDVLQIQIPRINMSNQKIPILMLSRCVINLPKSLTVCSNPSYVTQQYEYYVVMVSRDSTSSWMPCLT